MGDHQINAFEDTPTTPKPLVCPFCGEKLQESTFREGFVLCREVKGPEGEGDVFFLDGYQVTRTPPPWFRDMQERKSGSGCLALFLLILATVGGVSWIAS